MRTAAITRTTRETDITLTLTLDGSGKTSLSTGIGFFDHMLDALCRFGQLDLALTCRGDLHVDAHHTVEDVGICLGRAIRDALGDRAGIRRAASAYMPMDEAPCVCRAGHQRPPVFGVRRGICRPHVRAVRHAAGGGILPRVRRKCGLNAAFEGAVR